MAGDTPRAEDFVPKPVRIPPPVPRDYTGPKAINKGASIWWAYVIGILIGILIAFTITIITAWIIGSSVPHSDWISKSFYGAILGCKTT